MKKQYYSLAAVLMLLVVAGCSDGTSDSRDSCEPSSWYGTFDKIDEDCDINGGMPLFENETSFRAGDCENCISDGSSNERVLNEECKLFDTTPLGWEIETELDGDLLKVTVLSFECSATFRRRE